VEFLPDGSRPPSEVQEPAMGVENRERPVPA